MEKIYYYTDELNDEFTEFNGKTKDINEKYDLDIPSEDFQTIGGYVFGLLGREPEIGDKVEDKNLSFEVIELDGIRISRVIMRKDTPFVESEPQPTETAEHQ